MADPILGNRPTVVEPTQGQIEAEGVGGGPARQSTGAATQGTPATPTAPTDQLVDARPAAVGGATQVQLDLPESSKASSADANDIEGRWERFVNRQGSRLVNKVRLGPLEHRVRRNPDRPGEYIVNTSLEIEPKLSLDLGPLEVKAGVAYRVSVQIPMQGDVRSDVSKQWDLLETQLDRVLELADHDPRDHDTLSPIELAERLGDLNLPAGSSIAYEMELSRGFGIDVNRVGIDRERGNWVTLRARVGDDGRVSVMLDVADFRTTGWKLGPAGNSERQVGRTVLQFPTTSDGRVVTRDQLDALLAAVQSGDVDGMTGIPELQVMRIFGKRESKKSGIDTEDLSALSGHWAVGVAMELRLNQTERDLVVMQLDMGRSGTTPEVTLSSIDSTTVERDFSLKAGLFLIDLLGKTEFTYLGARFDRRSRHNTVDTDSVRFRLDLGKDGEREMLGSLVSSDQPLSVLQNQEQAVVINELSTKHEEQATARKRLRVFGVELLSNEISRTLFHQDQELRIGDDSVRYTVDLATVERQSETMNERTNYRARSISFTSRGNPAGSLTHVDIANHDDVYRGAELQITRSFVEGLGLEVTDRIKRKHGRGLAGFIKGVWGGKYGDATVSIQAVIADQGNLAIIRTAPDQAWSQAARFAASALGMETPPPIVDADWNLIRQLTNEDFQNILKWTKGRGERPAGFEQYTDGALRNAAASQAFLSFQKVADVKTDYPGRNSESNADLSLHSSLTGWYKDLTGRDLEQDYRVTDSADGVRTFFDSAGMSALREAEQSTPEQWQQFMADVRDAMANAAPGTRRRSELNSAVFWRTMLEFAGPENSVVSVHVKTDNGDLDAESRDFAELRSQAKIFDSAAFEPTNIDDRLDRRGNSARSKGLWQN